MKYGYFDETKKEYVITRPDTPARGLIISVLRNMARLFQTMQADTVLQNPELTEEFYVMFLISLTSREDIFI